MKKRLLNIIILFLATGLIDLYGQEHLSGLITNPELKNNEVSQAISRSKNIKSTIELPFIDDFAKSNVFYPDEQLWLDNSAFINVTYPINPPSIGVATLDAINSNGIIYPNASSSAFAADTLTSHIINLDYPGNATVFLSFYYQPGGLGDTPEKNDSLLLDFYSKDKARWINMWNVSFNAKDSVLKEYYTIEDSTINIYGDTITDLRTVFQNVILPVQGDTFLNDTFQFRFRNYASLSDAQDVEGTSSNSDHWHIDFIQLNKDRNINDTIINDISIAKPMHSLIKDYDAIPWHHYGAIYSDAMSDTISIFCKNLNNEESPAPASFFEISDTENLYSPTIIPGDQSIDLGPFESFYYTRTYNYNFPYNPNIDSINFKISSYITSTATVENLPFRWNDSTTFYQKFYNYYAYDDGTAENGYGIIGEGTENAMVAMQFESYIEDTLRGIQIYFNNLANSSSNRYFKIHVWDDNNGKPGNIIYTLEDQIIPTGNELNKFTLYTFDEEILVDDIFYVGWQKQNSSDMLNVGFDVNRINNNKLFYKFSNQWQESQFEGTVMIRPIFGKDISTITSNEDKQNLQNIIKDFNIYPNPANNQLNVQIDNYSQNLQYIIFDSYGRIHISDYIDEYPIKISNLSSGIYFIKIYSEKGETITKKFIVIH